MLEVLRRGSAELLWAGEGGVLLYDRGSGAYMLTARDRAALDGMLPLLPADCDLLVGHDLWYRDELAGRFGLWKEELCVQAAWMAPEPPEEPVFYDAELGLYVWGITHFGTSWDYVPAPEIH